MNRRRTSMVAAWRRMKNFRPRCRVWRGFRPPTNYLTGGLVPSINELATLLLVYFVMVTNLHHLWLLGCFVLPPLKMIWNEGWDDSEPYTLCMPSFLHQFLAYGFQKMKWYLDQSMWVDKLIRTNPYEYSCIDFSMLTIKNIQCSLTPWNEMPSKWCWNIVTGF